MGHFFGHQIDWTPYDLKLNIIISEPFFLQLFSSKIQFIYCLISLVSWWDGPMLDTKGKMFEI